MVIQDATQALASTSNALARVGVGLNRFDETITQALMVPFLRQPGPRCREPEAQ